MRTLVLGMVIVVIVFLLGILVGRASAPKSATEIIKETLKDTVIITKTDTLTVIIPGEKIYINDTLYVFIPVQTGGFRVLDTLFIEKWQNLIEISERLLLKIEARKDIELKLERDINLNWLGSRASITIYSGTGGVDKIVWEPSVLKDLIGVRLVEQKYRVWLGGGLSWTPSNITPLVSVGLQRRNLLLYGGFGKKQQL